MQTSKNGRTILVGVDEMEVRGYFEMALKCLGYPVELAQDGDEVLSCLQSSTSGIAAVLLDIMMPNRDGIDTLREIRRIDPNLPVIIISGDSSTLNVVTAMKSGATDFLCKPVAHDDLRKAVTRALEVKGADHGPDQGLPRQEFPNEGDSRASGAARLVRGSGPDPGRNRHWQRGDSPRPARAVPPLQQALHQAQLRCAALRTGR